MEHHETTPRSHLFVFDEKNRRFLVSLPDDRGDGYDNVRIGCTAENQETADFRLPPYLAYPIKKPFYCLQSFKICDLVLSCATYEALEAKLIHADLPKASGYGDGIKVSAPNLKYYDKLLKTASR